MRQDYVTVKSDDYVHDLIPKAFESKYPLAVINDDHKLIGFILRVHVLSGLVPEDVTESDEYYG